MDLSLSSRCLQPLAEEAGSTESSCRGPEHQPRAGTLPRSTCGSRQDQGSGCPRHWVCVLGCPLSPNRTCDVSDKMVRSKWNVACETIPRLALGNLTNNISSHDLPRPTVHFWMLSLIDGLLFYVSMKLDLLGSRESARGGKSNAVRCAKVLFHHIAMSKRNSLELKVEL